MKHTPGKWKVDLSDTNGHGGWSIKDDYHNICTVYANVVKAPRKNGDMAELKDNSESISNARLIVSAPELLEVCKLAVTYLEDGAPNTALKRLEEAITKAEGM